MADLEEIQKAINELPEQDYLRFRHWFMERDWERWDRRIIEDSRTGKLDFLVKEALDAKTGNELRDL